MTQASCDAQLPSYDGSNVAVTEAALPPLLSMLRRGGCSELAHSGARRGQPGIAGASWHVADRQIVSSS